MGSKTKLLEWCLFKVFRFLHSLIAPGFSLPIPLSYQMRTGNTSWSWSSRWAWRKTSSPYRQQILLTVTAITMCQKVFGRNLAHRAGVSLGRMGRMHSCQATEKHTYAFYCTVWTEINLKRTATEVPPPPPLEIERIKLSAWVHACSPSHFWGWGGRILQPSRSWPVWAT